MLASIIFAVLDAVMGSGATHWAERNALIMVLLSPISAMLIGSPAWPNEVVVALGMEENSALGRKSTANKPAAMSENTPIMKNILNTLFSPDKLHYHIPGRYCNNRYEDAYQYIDKVVETDIDPRNCYQNDNTPEQYS